MSQSELSPLEAFHNTFFYFVEGLKVLASDAEDQRRLVGGSHVAWELRNDVLDHGQAVLRCAGSFLSESERTNIGSLLNKVSTLSSDDSRSDEDALDQPQWDELRPEARHLIEKLAQPIAENFAFFNHGPPAPVPD